MRIVGKISTLSAIFAVAAGLACAAPAKAEDFKIDFDQGVDIEVLSDYTADSGIAEPAVIEARRAGRDASVRIRGRKDSAAPAKLEQMHIFVALGDGAIPIGDDYVNGVANEYTSEVVLTGYLNEHKAEKIGPKEYLLVKGGKTFRVTFVNTRAGFMEAFKF
ncbi:MAG: hypothetical protein ABIG11_04435, partial [bacterium]